MNQEFDVDRAYVARVIRDTFCKQKAVAQRVAKYKPSSRSVTADTWLEAADICIELGASPEEFVTAAFSYCNLPRGPTPNHLHTKAARRWYELYCSRTETYEDPDEDSIFQPTPAGKELQFRMDALKRVVFNRCGTVDPTDPQVIAFITDGLFGWDSLACMLFAGCNPEVAQAHGAVAELNLQQRPDLTAVIKAMTDV